MVKEECERILGNTKTNSSGKNNFWIEPITGITMIKIPGGKFMMGSSPSGINRFADDQDQHIVEVDDFWIGETEVTVTAYFISKAYRISKAGIIAPFEYVALPLSIFWSITIFGDWPDILSWLGMILIAGSGLYVFYNESVQGRKNDLYRPIPRNR